MSYRPTISIIINNICVDHGYYRNWFNDNLFYEAIALAALFRNCKTPEEYWKLSGGEAYDRSELIKYSEKPIIVDLTLQNIYCSYFPLSKQELSVVHTYDHPYSFKEFVQRDRLHVKHRNPLMAWPPERDYFARPHVNRLRRSYTELCNGEVEEINTSTGHMVPEQLSKIITYYRISFDMLDLDEILGMYKGSKELQQHCSTDTYKLLREPFRT